MTTPEPATKARNVRTAVAVALALVIAGATGAGYAAGYAVADRPEPAPTAAPAACVTALDTAEDLTEALLDTLRVAHTAMSAALDGDTAEARSSNAELAALDPQVEGHMNDYWRESDACRTGGTP